MKLVKNPKSGKKHSRTSPVRSQTWHLLICAGLLVLVFAVYQMTKFDRVVPNSTLGVVITTEPSSTAEPIEETEATEPTTEATEATTEPTTAATEATTEPVTEPTEQSEGTDPSAATEPNGESTEGTEPTEPTQPPAPADNSVALARALMEKMSLEEKILQMLITTPEDLTYSEIVTIAGEFTQNALAKYPIGGLYYSSQNILTEDQLSTMLSKSQNWNRFGMFTVVNRENDSGSRLSSIGVVRNTSSQSALASEDNAMLRSIGRELASDMSRVGLNVDLAPVADVRTAMNDQIGSRAFGDNGAVVSEQVKSMTAGMLEGGIQPCLKYFPGYGSTGGDVVDRTLEELRKTEFPVFKNAIDAGAGMIMVSHLVLAEVDSVPSDLSSKVVTDILRNELGFKGVVITEELDQYTITNRYTSGQAALLAVQAGCDIVFLPNDFHAAYEAMLKAAKDGALPEARINESVLRILTLKYRAGIITE